VRIALLIRERVVLAVVGHPVDDRALDRHGAEDRERRTQPRLRLERAVREHPVEADRHAEPDEDVHHGEDGEIQPRDEPAPQQVDRSKEADEGQHHGDDRDAALEGGGVGMRMRMRIGHIWKDARNRAGIIAHLRWISARLLARGYKDQNGSHQV
jgi:hypothetical protein